MFVSHLRDDRYPPTIPGLRQAIKERVPHVENVLIADRFQCFTCIVAVQLKWYVALGCGIWRWRLEQKIYRVWRAYAPAGCGIILRTSYR